MELIRNWLCPHSLSTRCIKSALGMVDGIKLKLSACVEGDVEEPKVPAIATVQYKCVKAVIK